MSKQPLTQTSFGINSRISDAMNIIKRLRPFLLAGILLVALAFSMVIFAYLLLIGAAAGLVLFAISWIRERFFRPPEVKPKQPSGRIIDSDDWRKL